MSNAVLGHLVAADTISAVATAPGRGGIGVIRVSGKDLSHFAQRLTGLIPPANYAQLTSFRDKDQAIIDRGILLYFPAPRSYTGEDVLEIQAHGGPVVMEMLLARTFELGARPAQPGEFTQRAFLNGKLDLVQAESVVDLIHVTTEAGARAAHLSLAGHFSQHISAIAESMVELRVFLESAIDFAEEEIDLLERDDIEKRFQYLKAQIDRLLQMARKGLLLREGIRVALVGQPNVGKSSLLNALLGVDRAIVTDIAGTTRDTLSEGFSLEGLPVTLVDTAGLRETDHPIEQLGIERSWAEIKQASIILWLVDAVSGITKEDERLLKACPDDIRKITVFNKIDLSHHLPEKVESADGLQIFCSAKNQLGIDLLKQAILAEMGGDVEGEHVFIARERHIRALGQARVALDRAREQLACIECAAEEVRLAHQALQEITGEFGSEDLLGEIFSRFCIGK